MVRYNPSAKEGLTNQQVNERIANNLVNFNDQPPTKTVKQIIISNFFTYFNFINVVLGSAIIIAGIYGNRVFDALKNCLFMGVIICNSIISIIQEVISKKTIDKLSVLAEAKVVGIRNGKEVNLGIEEIVLDDVLKLSLGNQVVTDAVILEGDVEVNESFLTGEVDPIPKHAGDMLLSGSFIVSGSCYAKVEHIGRDNYISTISSEAKYDKKVNSVIMTSFERMLKVLSVVIIPVGALLLMNQLKVTNYNVTASIFNTVGALIGMIPEGLLLLTSSVMAVSVVRLSKYHVLVQQLYCIETLARVDVICLDKTGTITEGAMEFVDDIPYNGVIKEKLDDALANVCYAFDNTNATMEAIQEHYSSKGIWSVKDKQEFSSSRKYSAVEFEERGTFYIGAPEFVLKDSYHQYQSFLDQYTDYRVLVVAYQKESLASGPINLSVLGFVLIQDKIRKEAPDTLKYFKEQGVTVKIISGDNFKTVCSIAKRAGIKDAKGMDATLLNSDNIDEMLEKYDVFGRVTPDQKKRIIESLQRKGHTVAMTGDGVNDVLALKKADCSIAMASGSDAAKNVSQLVLLDSNFASMPEVVAEGRRTINNVERSASLLLIKTIFTCILVVICIFMKSEYFYLPIHLSLITTCTISIPSFVLALEPNHNRVRGNFMLKVVGKSLPAALTVVFNVVMIVLFRNQFNIDGNLTSTLIVIMTGTTGFIFLSRLCRPFNWFRGGLFFALVSLFIYIVMFQSEFFDLSQVNFNTLLLYIVFAICSVWIFDKLNKGVDFLLRKLDKDYAMEKEEIERG
ncbi:MAG: HAD-IC family P-type ATPase [Bacilli bacterium]|nr:HAD-IC family P-type ATPase [Bacilli bacterium]